MGTQIFLGKPSTSIEQWIKNQRLKEPLCFTAEEAGSTVAMAADGETPTVSLEYSTDGNTWSPFVVGSTTVTLANIGNKVYIRATSKGNARISSPDGCNQFVMTGKISASGNVDTLLDQNGNATQIEWCYFNMFYNCTSLTTAPELPATTLASNCYNSMFYNCTSLTTAPSILPATTLADYCYASMFQGCTSLTQAPALPATTLASNCYNSMFYKCSSLTTAPELPATTLADGCYASMFQGCTSLTQAPAIKTYTPNLRPSGYMYMLDMVDSNTWGQLTSCNWPDLTLSEAESMVLNETIFGENNLGKDVRISITCKDGSGTAYYDSKQYSWVFEH